MWRRATWLIPLGILVCSTSLSLTVSATQSDYETALDQARLLVSAGDFEGALQFAGQALELDSRGVDAVRMSALCQWQLGRYRDGLPYARRLVELRPKEPEARLFLADFEGVLGNIHEGLAAIGEAMILAPGHPSAVHRLRALASVAENSLLGAFESLASNVPKDLDVAFALATMYRRHGRLLDALAKLDGSRSLEASRVFEVHREIALVYADVRAWDEARSHLDDALRLRPLDTASLFAKAMMHSRQSETKEAIEIYRTLLEKTPENAMIHFRLGEAYDSENRPDEAEQAYQRALRLEPRPPGLYFRLGKLHLDRGNPEKARPLLSRSVEENPSQAEGHLELGHAQDRLENIDAARDHYAKAIELNPSLSVAHRSLGNLEMRVGNKDKGLVALSRFQELKSLEKDTERLVAEVESHPEDFDAKQTLISHLVVTKELPLALRLAQRYLLVAPELNHYLLLGDVHLAMGDDAGACRLFEEATRLAPESELALRREAASCAAPDRPPDRPPDRLKDAARAKADAAADAWTADGAHCAHS